MSRSRRSILTFGGSLTYTLVTITIGFLTVPFLLRWLGAECFGACRALTDWYGQFKLLELGIGGSLLAMLARANGRGDSRYVHHILGAGVRAYLVTTAGFFIAGLLLAAFVTRLIPVAENRIGDLRTASLLGVVSFIITPLIPFRLLADARQEGFTINGFLLVQSLTTTGVALFLASAGWGITGQILAFVGGTVLFQTLVTVKVWLFFPTAAGSGSRTRIPKEVWRELWSLSPPTLFLQVCNRVSLMSDAILVAVMLEPALVVPMVITQRLATLAQSQLQGVVTASWAGLAELHALGRHDLLRRRLLELTTIVTRLSIAVLAPITAFNQDFVSRWVGADRFAGNLFTLVAAANAFLLSLLMVWGCCFDGTGQVARLAPMTAISTVVNLTISVFLTWQLGIVGPLLGSLTALLLINSWWLPCLLKKYFHVSFLDLCKAVLAPVAVGIPYWAIDWWLARAHPPRGWFPLALEMAGSALAFLGLAWIVILSSGERAEWIGRMRLLLRPWVAG